MVCLTTCLRATIALSFQVPLCVVMGCHIESHTRDMRYVIYNRCMDTVRVCVCVCVCACACACACVCVCVCVCVVGRWVGRLEVLASVGVFDCKCAHTHSQTHSLSLSLSLSLAHSLTPTLCPTPPRLHACSHTHGRCVCSNPPPPPPQPPPPSTARLSPGPV